MPIDPAKFARYSVALSERLNATFLAHLLQHARKGKLQEELCFALWQPSAGQERFTALLSSTLLPLEDERLLTGNVSFTSAYLERVIMEARRARAGIALLHNHLGPGWQRMSLDDIAAEEGRAALALAGTGLPLLGLTAGTDGAWSARFWIRSAPKKYDCRWCTDVRVVGQSLFPTWHPELYPPPSYRDELRRSISVWGDQAQSRISRVHVGIVGLGSVGAMVSEGLARTGVQRVTMIDFDRVERHNLDRLLGATMQDADAHASKVEVASRQFLSATTAPRPAVLPVAASLVDCAGYRAALDCDVLFSCVDRPWPRRVLNHIAYAHLIPVIDGGVIARMRRGRCRGVEWSVRTAAPGRACLACVGAFDPAMVDLERRGMLDDPTYLSGLDADHQLRRNENVFAFSMSLASHELLQFISLVTSLLGMPDLGEQRYHYNLREMRVEDRNCDRDCELPSLVATGDSVYPAEAMLRESEPLTAQSPVADLSA